MHNQYTKARLVTILTEKWIQSQNQCPSTFLLVMNIIIYVERNGSLIPHWDTSCRLSEQVFFRLRRATINFLNDITINVKGKRMPKTKVSLDISYSTYWRKFILETFLNGKWLMLNAYIKISVYHCLCFLMSHISWSKLGRID